MLIIEHHLENAMNAEQIQCDQIITTYRLYYPLLARIALIPGISQQGCVSRKNVSLRKEGKFFPAKTQLHF